MSDKPGEFEGVITIEWPWGVHPAGMPVPGWKAAPRLLGGGAMTTASHITIHVDAQDVTWAEVTMLTGADGRPLYDGMPVVVPGPDHGEVMTGTFAFLVAGMSIREAADAER